MDGAAIARLGHPLVAAAIVGMTMLAETVISARHERRLRSRGAVEPTDDVYAWMQVAYPLGFVACIVEQVWRATPWNAWAAGGLVVFILGKAIKYVAIATLGERWTFRVLPLGGRPLVRHGIYRWMRYPNYVGVIGEVVGIALWMRAPVAGILFVLTFGDLLRRRCRVEERALASASLR